MSDAEVDTPETDRLLLECRVCLMEKAVRFMSWDIFTPLTEKGFSAGTTIALELSRLANVEIQNFDGFPKYICKSCLEKLVSSIELVNSVKRSEEILQHKKQTGKLHLVQTWPKPIELDKNLNEEVLRNSMDVDVKQEMISDEDFGDTGMDQEDNLSLTDIKLEPEDIAEHPAIQVTVNDSQATNPVIELEEENGLPLQHNKIKRAHIRPVELTIRDTTTIPCDKRLKPVNVQTRKELLVLLTKIDNYSGSTLKNQINHELNSTNRTQNPGPPCNCKMNCSSKITFEQRQNICNYYHSQSKSKQREFVISFTNKGKTCSKTLASKRNRQHTFKYYLPPTMRFICDIQTSDKIRVCKTMFENTVSLSAKMRTERVWKSYETFRMDDGRGKCRQNTDTDAVKSVCAHFNELQNDKLAQLEALSSGLRRESIYKLTYTKMFKLYRLWVISKDYTHTVKARDTYVRTLLKFVPQDKIQSLQKRSSIAVGTTVEQRSNRSHTKKLCDAVQFFPVKNEISEEMCSESLNIDLFANSALNESENNALDVDPFKEDNIENNYIYYDDDDPMSGSTSSESESDISNFSDNFKEEVNQELNENKNKETKMKVKRKKKAKKISEDDAEDSTYESSDEDNDLENIKKENVRLEMCTRNKSDGTKLDSPDVLQFNMNNAFMHRAENKTEHEEALLTAKRKRLSRDPAVIRQYCKYHGLEYKTESGIIIPKKVLGPPCNNCMKHCADKISQDQRQFIFNHYWGLGNKKQQMLLLRKFIMRIKTQRKLRRALKNRDYGIHYFLPTTSNFDSKTEKVRVCLKMFYNTFQCPRFWFKSTRNWNQGKPIAGKSSQLVEADKDMSEATEENIDEVLNEDSSKPKKLPKSSRRKRPDPDQDHTVIDFVYRAMPFHEFMSHFGKEKNEGNPVKKKNKLLEKRLISKSGKIVAEKIMGPPCKCKLGCYNKITDSQRLFLFEYYWSLSFCKQRPFLVRFSTQSDTKFYPSSKSKILREKYYEYYLPITKDFDGDKVKVCQTMFINTLVVSQKRLYSSWRKYERGKFSDDRGISSKGCSRLTDKFLSAKAQIDILRREDPELKAYKIYSKQYPDGILSPAKLYKHYNEWFDSTLYSKKIETLIAYSGIYRRIKKLHLS